ncbi:uncharacterized protein LOC143422140 [Xylocopa sonorina]|uniref:uncharacterized protein LOC143422140 n=1 Tax=Xylocopa sonorina TaxID=1818115 RepID=UPI00403AB3F2
MSLIYKCIICQRANNSIMDLHSHHVQYHNPIELSQTIIKLQGLKTWNETKPTRIKYLKPLSLDDSNNNKNSYNNFFIQPELQNITVYEDKHASSSPRKFGHDSTMCAINCSEFIAWEHELNKKQEIDHKEFLDSIESLCNELSNKKRRGRKKKERTDMDDANAASFKQYIENVIGVKNIIMEPSNSNSSQSPTTSFWDTQDSVTNTTINNDLTQVEKKIEDTKTDRDTSILIHNQLYNPFSWNSVTAINDAGKQEMSIDENIYSETI